MIEPVFPKLADLNIDPLPHQQRVADKLQDDNTPGQIAMHGLGTGKTITAINAADKTNRPLMAITPAALRNNMRETIDSTGFKGDSQVLSYQEAMNRLEDPDFRDQASKSVVALDEAHRAGRPDAARSRIPAELPAGKKLFLTGTPIRNEPSEVAGLVNSLRPGALPSNPKDFKKKFLSTKKVPVGFWGRLKGIQPGQEQVPTNLHEFERATQGLVDYHENVDRSAMPSHDEHIVEVPMSARQHATYQFAMGKYPRLAYKIRHGIPISKAETRDFRAFMTAPRQIANHPGAYNAKATDEDAPKIQSMVDEIEQRHGTDPNYRGVSYSAYLDSGVQPLSRELTKRGIKHHIFTGSQNDAERAQIINDYNTGKVPHLIISGAGAEGLDLKGTKLMQITEPHWNEKQIDQVRGRAIRYMSHAHLPENERHVEVQRFHSVPRKSLWDTIVGRKRPHAVSADEYLHRLATKKQRLNEPFLRIMRGESADQVTKTAEAVSTADWKAFDDFCDEYTFGKAAAAAEQIYGDDVAILAVVPIFEHPYAEAVPEGC
jgi:superfamily II DNA or RNA helicase